MPKNNKAPAKPSAETTAGRRFGLPTSVSLPHMPGGQLVALLRNPPNIHPVYQAYNRLRQQYVVVQTMRHFKAREDDPAHLYQKKLLDVGCGEATIAEFLALAGAEITAIDPNPAALAAAKASAEAFGAPVTFVRGRAEDLLRTGEKYDVILALDLLESVEDPARMVWVIRQLLAPGGIIVISAITRTWRAWFAHIFLSEYLYRRIPVGTRAYKRFFTPAQLAALCKGQGLHLENVQQLRFSSSRRSWVQSMPGSSRATRYLATLVEA